MIAGAKPKRFIVMMGGGCCMCMRENMDAAKCEWRPMTGKCRGKPAQCQSVLKIQVGITNGMSLGCLTIGN